MATTLDPLSRWGVQRRLFGIDDERLNRLLELAADDLERVLTQHETAARNVMDDPGLNTSGRRTRLRALHDATVAAVNGLEQTGLTAATLRQLDAERTTRRGALENRLDYVPAPDGAGGLVPRIKAADRPVHEQREREIRDRLLTLDPLARVEVARTAALADDTETLRAIAHAPRPFPLLAAEDLAAVDQLHAETHYAAEAAAVRAIETTLDTLRWNFTTARAALGMAEGAATDAVGDAAGGPAAEPGADAADDVATA